jgi:hypothetical protein
MRSVCVVCTRARALITDRDRRHRHAVLCTLLLLRPSPPAHTAPEHPPRCASLPALEASPSPPLLLALEAPPWPLAAVAACARARGFSIAAVAACARGSSLAAVRVGPFLSLFTCLWLFRRSAELLLRPYHCCRWRFFSFFSFFSFLSYFSFLGIAFSPHIYYTYFILFYYV